MISFFEKEKENKPISFASVEMRKNSLNYTWRLVILIPLIVVLILIAFFWIT